MTRYVPNPGFEDEWLASSDAVQLVGDLAAKVAPVAESLARKRDGYLADSIEAESGIVDGVATGRVNARDFKANWHEFGTRKLAAQPYLRPAMAQVVGPVTGGDK